MVDGGGWCKRQKKNQDQRNVTENGAVEEEGIRCGEKKIKQSNLKINKTVMEK